MIITTEEIKILKNVLQDTNINFLIGSGLSVPYFPTLGNIEMLLSDLDNFQKISENQKLLIRASLLKKYFDDVVYKNLALLTEKNDILTNYSSLLTTLNAILLRRKSTILDKQVNIFTTNIDIFLERAFDSTGIELNDGFSGRFLPIYNISNFKKSLFKKSLHYDNSSEIPVFNLLKIHGSVSWKIDIPEQISFSHTMDYISLIEKSNLHPGPFLIIDPKDTIETIVSSKLGSLKTNNSRIKKFIEAYSSLSIVNPDKQKFQHTLLNQTYYELLRLFSNELEKENTVLFVLGCSLSDEHIRSLLIRSANSNPTLIIYIVCHSSESLKGIEKLFDQHSLKNENLKLISPARKKDKGGDEIDEYLFDLKNINEIIFKEILKQLGTK